MEDLTLSRDYRQAWTAAKRMKTVEALEAVFNDLCNELGLPDAERMQVNEAAGLAAALRKNSQEAPGIKRQP